MTVVRNDPLDSFEALVERVPVAVLDPAGGTRYVSPAAAAVAGVDATAALDDAGRLFVEDDRPALAEAFASLVDGPDTETAVTARGAGRPADDALDVTLYDFTADPAAGFVVALLADDARAARLRRLLRSVVDPDDGLAAAASPRAVVDRLIALGSVVPEIELGCYLRDGASAPLRPVGPSAAGDVESAVRAVDRTGEPRAVDPESLPLAALSDEVFVGALAYPMGDHGVLVTGLRERASVIPDLLTALSLVAATASLALDRLAARRALERAERVRRRCRAGRDRLVEATETERRAERAVLEASSSSAVTRAVCAALADAEAVELAWFGTVAPGGSELVPEAVAGDGESYLSAVTFGPGEGGPPAARVLTERGAVAERDVAGGFASADWRRAALDAGLRSVLAVPVGGDDATHGVLVVYGREAGGLDGPIRAVVEHLRHVVAYALTTAELRTLALGNTTVELELSVPARDGLLADLAAATEASVRFESAVPKADGTTRVYLTVDAPGERVLAATTDLDGVVDARRLADREDGALVEVGYEGETVPGTLASLGAVVTAAETSGSEVRATVTVSRDVDVREFVDAVREHHPGAALLARRAREDPVEADRRFRQRVESRLTERQYEALQAAHYGGYFESPRRQNGSDIAETLGIAQSTFAGHIRGAQRKLLTLLFRSG